MASTPSSPVARGCSTRMATAERNRPTAALSVVRQVCVAQPLQRHVRAAWHWERLLNEDVDRERIRLVDPRDALAVAAHVAHDPQRHFDELLVRFRPARTVQHATMQHGNAHDATCSRDARAASVRSSGGAPGDRSGRRRKSPQWLAPVARLDELQQRAQALRVAQADAAASE